ncbi:uncharacterized protein LOC124885261 [Capsicum annuum]|uniref:uncharacterized protein LOC124885261 n=1 Tax=Capsicum annuum TaxID=4072 RepID=UPI001FB05C5B|nr:uncharacterized protein LOC124885261 [Capsicum annuum]
MYDAPYPLCKNKSAWRVVIKTKPVGRVEVEDTLDVAYQNDISSDEQRVDDELAGELQHSKGLYEEFNPSELRLNVGDYGQGTSRENEEENPCDENESGEEEFLDENETNEEEFLDENEITDEEELMSAYESNEED